ncbi:MAG: amidohydrolase, partial [Deltaproteobacteria bacterium]|nr:amidohydrolase [Deltaproteobacteria bacterium]
VDHITDHMAYVNSRALEIAAIGPETMAGPGGWIDKAADGRPSGLLIEPAAQNLVYRFIPPYPKTELAAAFKQTIAYYHRAGITSCHDAGIGWSYPAADFYDVYRRLEREGDLTLRVYLTTMAEQYKKISELGLGTGFGSPFLRLGGVKLFQDGSIQIQTAALLSPYHHRSDLSGELMMSQETLDELVMAWHLAGFQLAVHANGDRAIESVLTALEKSTAIDNRTDRRHMIIHCQLANIEQLARMKRIGVIPSFFINHVYYWGDRHASIFLGPERSARIDPLASAVKLGLPFTLHSDLPVTPVDPLLAMHNAVNRVTRQGVLLGKEECIGPWDALKAYTIDAARCSFEEDLKGSIKPGRYADFAILSADPLTVPPDTIKDIRVLTTVVGGRRVFGTF